MAAKNLELKPGLVYELRPIELGYYKNFHGSPVYMAPDDVWEYGETTVGEQRYSDEFYKREKLKMFPIFYGNTIEIKIQEKIMIYGYVFKYGHLPPGNKIFR